LKSALAKRTDQKNGKTAFLAQIAATAYAPCPALWPQLADRLGADFPAG